MTGGRASNLIDILTSNRTSFLLQQLYQLSLFPNPCHQNGTQQYSATQFLISAQEAYLAFTPSLLQSNLLQFFPQIHLLNTHFYLCSIFITLRFERIANPSAECSFENAPSIVVSAGRTSCQVVLCLGGDSCAGFLWFQKDCFAFYILN